MDTLGVDKRYLKKISLIWTSTYLPLNNKSPPPIMAQLILPTTLKEHTKWGVEHTRLSHKTH